jgi:hypothetical protein
VAGKRIPVALLQFIRNAVSVNHNETRNISLLFLKVGTRNNFLGSHSCIKYVSRVGDLVPW